LELERSRRELNVAARQELKLTGTLASEDHTFRVLAQRQDMTGAERSWASHYEVNDVIRYTRVREAIEIGAGIYASVVAIDPAVNQLTVEKANQELATYDPCRLTGVSVYREDDRGFSVGDRIQFTAPNKSLGVANRTYRQREEFCALSWTLTLPAEICFSGLPHF